MPARLGLALGAGLVAAVPGAVVLAILDLYVTGHGRPSLLRPWIAWPEAGVHLSRGDALMFLASSLTDGAPGSPRRAVRDL